MSIQKKSLISTLKTAKKAHVASAPLATATDAKSEQGVKLGTSKLRSAKLYSAKLRSAKLYTSKLRSAKLNTAKLNTSKLRSAKLNTKKV